MDQEVLMKLHPDLNQKISIFFRVNPKIRVLLEVPNERMPFLYVYFPAFSYNFWVLQCDTIIRKQPLYLASG